MKHAIRTATLLFTATICTTIATYGQSVTTTERSPFRRGYMQLGLNLAGNKLNNSLSPEANILKGNHGASAGIVFELGKSYYFLKRTPGQKFNVGLDWTTISLSYNSLKKGWGDYARAAGEPDADITAPMIVSLSTKLGPVVSYNPVEQLVIDLRGQVIAGISGTTLQYEESNRGFNAFDKGSNSDEDAGIGDIFKNTFSVKPGFGITVRRGIVGLSFDYSSYKQSLDYTTSGNNAAAAAGKNAKIPFAFKQLKLGLYF
ncbi:MAG TPA: hypothetical protein VF421_09515 [Niabella sp.]